MPSRGFSPALMPLPASVKPDAVGSLAGWPAGGLAPGRLLVASCGCAGFCGCDAVCGGLWGCAGGVNGFGADLMTFATALVAARRILSKFMGVFLEEAGLMADAGFRTR